MATMPLIAESAVETYIMMPASKIKKLRLGLVRSFLCMLIGMFALPSLVFAAEPTQSYDRQSIRYPSMYTGQIWAKVGGNSSPNLDVGAGKASTKIGGDSPSNPGADTKQVSTKGEGSSASGLNQESKILKNETNQGTEIKKRLKKKSSRKVRAQNNNGSQTVTANNKPLQLISDNKENQKTSTNKPVQPKRILLADGKKAEMPKVDPPAKNWHHKQELYDIDCSEKLARVVVTYYFNKREALLKSSKTPDAEWYHIYPGSFEEHLYTEICNPHW
jgi:hypothetical protein